MATGLSATGVALAVDFRWSKIPNIARLSLFFVSLWNIAAYLTAFLEVPFKRKSEHPTGAGDARCPTLCSCTALLLQGSCCERVLEKPEAPQRALLASNPSCNGNQMDFLFLPCPVLSLGGGEMQRKLSQPLRRGLHCVELGAKQPAGRHRVLGASLPMLVSLTQR